MLDPDLVLMLGRGAVFTTALMLWGAALFRLRLMPGAAPIMTEALWPWILMCGLVVSLPARVAQMGNGWVDAFDPSTIWLVIMVTGAGKSIVVQFVTVLCLMLALHWRLPRLSVTCAAIILAAQVMTGHAAASTGLFGLFRQANGVAHLLAAGAWLGALPFVLRIMRTADFGGARKTLIHYSREGHMWVALVLATGIAATLMTVDGMPVRWDVPYQALLSLKIAITLGMVGLAIWNRYGLVPRLSRHPAARRTFLRNTQGEIALGITATALVATFGMLDPQ